MNARNVVVDTNVAIVANGRDTHAGIACQIACIEAIGLIREKRTVFLDDQDLIFEEYRRHLDFKGEPGVGDAFFKHIFNHMHSGKRVRRIRISPNDHSDRGFDELPRNTLDPSDRKFLAVAVVAKASLVNATDSDWGRQASLFDALSVPLEQLCPRHAGKPG